MTIKALIRGAVVVCAAALTITAIGIFPAVAATHTVNDPNDHDDGYCTAGDCTLREAVTHANNGDTVIFDDRNTYTLTLGEIVINKNLIIDGLDGSSHGNTVISGGGASRVFNITSGTVTIKDLGIINGYTDQDPGGGGILNDGTLTLDNVAVSNCSTEYKNGGGVRNRGTLYLTVCRISGNDTQGGYSGGGIHNQVVSGAAVLDMQDTTVSLNLAGGGGGGISSFEGQVTLTRCTFDQNQTGLSNKSGGALYLTADSVAITDCTFTSNTASNNGGAIDGSGSAGTIYGSTFTGNSCEGSGGALSQLNGSIAITNSTFTGNSADQSGGALYFYQLDFDPVSRLSFVTLSGNTADADCGGGGTCEDGDGGGLHFTQGMLRLKGVFLAGNSDGSVTTVNPDLTRSAAGGTTLQTGGYNLIGDKTGADTVFPAGAPNVNNDYVGTAASPLACALGPLADNGGETHTCALPSGSLAINHGPPDNTDAGDNPVPLDQRGEARLRGGRVDIGAYEVPAGSGSPLAVLLD